MEEFKKHLYSVREIDFYECKRWILDKHYAKRMPSISYSFGLYKLNELIGICTFGSGANLNMKGMVKGYDAIELNRLVIKSQPKNTLSYFVSKCLKLLPSPIVIVSYADPNNNHSGYIYQATNWIYTGKGTRKDGGIDSGVSQFIKDGKNYHGKSVCELVGSSSKDEAKKHGFERVYLSPKHRYLYFRGTKKDIKKMRKANPYPILDYPKDENIRYDDTAKIETQLILF